MGLPRRNAGAWRSRLLAALALVGATGARANGAFPDEFSIHFPAGAPNRILMGANFGLLVSEDNGATWRYSCEPWIVSGSNAAINSAASVTFYQVAPNGTLLAAAVDITRSTDLACTWPPATGAVAQQVITDIFASPADSALVFTIVLDTADSAGYYMLASHDGGATFDPGRIYDTPDVLTGVEAARSPSNVIYASSVSTSGTAKLIQSTQSGAPGTWTERTIPASAGTQ